VSVTAEITKVCRVCEDEKPLDEFVKSRGVRLRVCKVCSNAQKRAREVRLRAAGVHVPTSQERLAIAARRRRLGEEFVTNAPDPQPARLLVELLRYDRAFGLDFESAWSEGAEFVLERVSGRCAAREREEWRIAFESQRNAWEAAWRRVDGPGVRLSPALLDAVAGKRSDIEG
jgi:hypothetical protein